LEGVNSLRDQRLWDRPSLSHDAVSSGYPEACPPALRPSQPARI
jgi:hypothetical protein